MYFSYRTGPEKFHTPASTHTHTHTEEKAKALRRAAGNDHFEGTKFLLASGVPDDAISPNNGNTALQNEVCLNSGSFILEWPVR